MSDIPKSKRAYSNLEAHHKALEIRRKIAVELLASFAYSEKKLEEAVRKQTQHIQDPEHRAEAAQAIRNLEEDFACWFIKRHRDRVDDLCCDIAQHLRGANTMSNAVKVKRASFGQAYYDAYANTTTTPEKEEITVSNSPLVTYTNITKNKTSPRNHAIDTITIHCIVGQWTAKQGCDFFATTDRECSANYIVGKDGSIGLSVDEADRSWCTSSRENDNRAITIEVASDTEHPYAVTDAAYAALIKLIADICKRNGIKKLIWSTNKADRVNHANGCNMTVHRDYANKACPGQYLYDRHGAIAAAVNELLGSGTTQPPEAAPGAVQGFPATPFTVRVIIPDLNYRKGPGMSYAVRGQTGKGVFTITEVQDGWGKLKSGAGWIYLDNPDYCTIQGVAAKPAEPDPADVLAQEIAGKVKGSGLDPADVLNRVEKILGVA